MLRRDFIAGLGSAVVWPRAVRAQQGDRIRRVGVLIGLAESDKEGQERLAAFRQGLARRGWLNGRNLHIDYRYVPGIGANEAQGLAQELVALAPDVILAHGGPLATAMQRETRTIPIVFVTVSDPIGSGLVATLAQPGGNLTGLLQYEDTIAGKWLGMLKQIAPEITRAALLTNPKTTPYDYLVRGAAVAARSLAIDLVPLHVETPADMEAAISSFGRTANGALLTLPDSTILLHRDLVISLAARHHLPAVYHLGLFVKAGGLMSYGGDAVDQFRQAAAYVDRILRGDKPTELPVQTPVKYETFLNLKTAKALGLTVPPALLVAADEVIE
jgi:putative ABC transport system substrate-binding protein